MSFLVTLESYGTQDRHYHISKLKHSLVNERIHYHKHFQFCFVSRGEILHSQENELVHLERGDAFIVPPGFNHRMNFVDEYSEIYCLSFDESLFHTDYAKSSTYRFLSTLQSHALTEDGQQVKLRVIFNDTQRKNIQSLMDCLLLEQESTYPPELSAAALLISSIICYLSQSYYQQPQNEAQFKAITAYNTTLSRCTEYIDQHYYEAITLNTLAKQFAMSRSYFTTLFPQFTGLSLKQYVTKRRILEAESLIRSRPELTLHEISALIGYEDPSTFYRNFVRIVGISPSKYKKICSESQSG